MAFGDRIMDYMSDIRKDLNELISIRSVSCESSEQAEEALDYMLKRAAEMGFVTKKVSRDSGHIEYGEGEDKNFGMSIRQIESESLRMLRGCISARIELDTILAPPAK